MSRQVVLAALLAYVLAAAGMTVWAAAATAGPLGWAAVVLADVAALTGAVVWRWVKREEAALERVESALAEFRMPEPNGTVWLRALLGHMRTFVDAVSQRSDGAAKALERFEFMSQHSDDMMLQVDADGHLKYAVGAVGGQLGYRKEELLGRKMLELLHPDDLSKWIRELKQSAKQRRSAMLEGRFRHADGHYVLLEVSLRHAYGLNGRVSETIAMSRSLESRRALLSKLELAARTDVLTGLRNRAAFNEELERLRRRCDRRPFGLFLFDLDRFKQVNDSLGHAAGDAYLVEVARRVGSVLRQEDVFSRIGGDEFVLLFQGAQSEAMLQAVATRIIDAVSKPFLCHGELLFPKTSVGVLWCNDPSLPADELISRADRAMYVAKSQGGNLAVIHDDTQADTLRQAFAVEQELTLAIQQGRLAVQYQPVVCAKSKTPLLAEALVRLREPDGRLIGPSHFIEVAEKTGLIFQVGAWVLEQACLTAVELERRGRPVSISVNVSPRQLMHLNYVQSVEAVLARTGASAASIVLEVTESGVLQDANRANEVLRHLRGLGFKLALDDFGSGYSSISMLKTFPFDILKIDRMFAADAQGANIGPSTLSSIIDIGKSLDLTIIAEGIETQDQSLNLQRLGCDLLQGFLFHRPLDKDALLAVVQASHGQLVTGVNRKLVNNEALLFDVPSTDELFATDPLVELATSSTEGAKEAA